MIVQSAPALGPPDAPRGRRLNHLATALISLALTLAAAASECKALDKAACQRAPAFTWVDPYKRLDEVKVKGFCHQKDPPDKPNGD